MSMRYVVKTKDGKNPSYYHSDYSNEGEALTMKQILVKEKIEDRKVFVSLASTYAIKRMK